MTTVNLIGAGKVGFHLAKKLAFSDKIKLMQIYSRSAIDPHKWGFLPHHVECITALNQLKKADISVICVSDNAIKSVSGKLAFEQSLVVHTSGNTSMFEMSSQNRRGVLYPVQSFNFEKEILWENIPLCLECEFSADISVLKTVSEELSKNIHFISEKQRKKLHIAAVFANNFTNHLIHIAQNICNENQIPLTLISTLIEETFYKLKLTSAFNAQSGPALRNDSLTISEHTASLEGIYKDIYTLITKSIQQTYGKKL